MCQHLTRKTQTWLRVPNRGYTCHILFMRGYTWLYTACVSKVPEVHTGSQQVVGKLYIPVIYGFMTQAVAIRQSSWLYDSFFSSSVCSLPGKPNQLSGVPGRGYLSHVVIMRGYTGYISYMYQ